MCTVGALHVTLNPYLFTEINYPTLIVQLFGFTFRIRYI